MKFHSKFNPPASLLRLQEPVAKVTAVSPGGGAISGWGLVNLLSWMTG